MAARSNVAGKSLLVLRHEPFEHLGHFARILEGRGVSFVYHDLDEPLALLKKVTDRSVHGPAVQSDQLPGSGDRVVSPLFQANDYAAIVILGGPMSANDEIGGLKDELRLIDVALNAGTPLLGICLGAQLIAKALGARVYRNSVLEIGWKPVFLTEGGRRDPVLGELPSPATFFHWHGETFDLPAGAEHLAWSEECRNQAYRYADRVYGIQFHPEVTAEMIEDWSRQPVNCGDVAMLEGPIDAHRFDGAGLAERVLDGWLDLVGSLDHQAPFMLKKCW